MAAFSCNLIVDGIIFSFGLIVTNLATSFNVPVSTVSWVASLLSGFYLLAGKNKGNNKLTSTILK